MLNSFSVKGLVFAFAAFLAIAPLQAQSYTVAETKAFEKSKSLFGKKKYDKAIESLNKVLFAHVHDEQLWQHRVLYERSRYQDALTGDFIFLAKKSQKNPNGAEIDMSDLKSPKYYDEMLYASMAATLYAPHQDLASLLLNENYNEPKVDTLISQEAKDLLVKGLEAQQGNDNAGAIRYFEKAYNADTLYYTAAIDLAYAYYKDEKYEKALEWFGRASRMQPEMLDPRFYLIEINMERKDWQSAYNVCLDAMIQYPFTGYFSRMEKICEKMNKTFTLHWMERDYFPAVNTIQNQEQATSQPWSFYTGAKERISSYCDEDGIVSKPTTITDQKYLEVYCWEYMLKKSDEDTKEMGFARRMQEQSNLDCFAMFSMYHITFRHQYRHFRDNNRERLKAYIETQLIR